MGLRGAKEDFPLLVNSPNLHFLDTAASSQKPKQVLDAVNSFYSNEYANVHRGSYELSQRATAKYEGSRKKIAQYLGISSSEELIFTHGTTDSINIVAEALNKSFDSTKYKSVVVTRSEHHANFVPWQSFAKANNCEFLITELSEDLRTLDLEDFKKKLLDKPYIVALSSSSNVLGNCVPWKEMASLAKQSGALVLVDFAQSVAHEKINIDECRDLIDFLSFSSHKIFGPTGVGVLWAKKEWLLATEPKRFGGDMISVVEDHQSTWNDLPWKWEPGTPPIAQAVGMAAGFDYIYSLGLEDVAAYESDLTFLAIDAFKKIEGIEIYGDLSSKKRNPLLTFNLEGVHSLDLASWLDQRGLALRSGHHCTQPLHRKLGKDSSIRASFSVYNDSRDVDALVEGVQQASIFFKKIKSKRRSR